MNNNDLHNEQALLELIASGDTTAFETLYHHYKKKIYSTAYGVLQSSTHAQDALQEIFIKIWVNRGKLKNMNYFPAWLNTIIRNHLYYKLRQQAKREKPLDYLINDDHDSFTEKIYNEAEFKELVVLVEEAMSKLSPQQQRVFELSRLQGLKHREIATEMNLSQETVKKYIMEALRQVRDYLQQHGRTVSSHSAVTID